MAYDWNYKGVWPVTDGAEIMSSNFEDLRKMFWAIQRMGTGGGYTLPSLWKRSIRYHLGTKVSWPDEFGVLRPWVCSFASSLAEVPGEATGWIMIPREDVYTDYNHNSGCKYAEYNAIYKTLKLTPAHMFLPPQFNKYTQQRIDNGTYSTPYEKLQGYSQEKAVELAERVENYGGVNEYGFLVSGPVGPQYQEWHNTEHVSLLPPYYWNYYVVNGTPIMPSDYFKRFQEHIRLFGYDQKMQGYQSYIEWLCETAQGGEFQWPLDGDALTYAIQNSKPVSYRLRDLYDNEMISYYDNIWNCNWSAFEKCLELCNFGDWYLDTRFPPDPAMLKLYQNGPRILGVWRRTWSHSFGFPYASTFSQGDNRYLTMWPAEKGLPPGYGESMLYYTHKENIVAIWDEYRARMKDSDYEALYTRHSGVQNYERMKDEEGDIIRWAWDLPSEEQWKIRWNFEITKHILNEAKEVLECLQYLTIDLPTVIEHVYEQRIPPYGVGDPRLDLKSNGAAVSQLSGAEPETRYQYFLSPTNPTFMVGGSVNEEIHRQYYEYYEPDDEENTYRYHVNSFFITDAKKFNITFHDPGYHLYPFSGEGYYDEEREYFLYDWLMNGFDGACAYAKFKGAHAEGDPPLDDENTNASYGGHRFTGTHFDYYHHTNTLAEPDDPWTCKSIRMTAMHFNRDYEDPELTITLNVAADTNRWSVLRSNPPPALVENSSESIYKDWVQLWWYLVWLGKFEPRRKDLNSILYEQEQLKWHVNIGKAVMEHPTVIMVT